MELLTNTFGIPGRIEFKVGGGGLTAATLTLEEGSTAEVDKAKPGD